MSPYILPLNFIYGRTGTIMDWFLRINILVFTLVWFLYFKKKSDAENLPMGKITQSLILDTEKSNCIIQGLTKVKWQNMFTGQATCSSEDRELSNNLLAGMRSHEKYLPGHSQCPQDCSQRIHPFKVVSTPLNNTILMSIFLIAGLLEAFCFQTIVIAITYDQAIPTPDMQLIEIKVNVIMEKCKNCIQQYYSIVIKNWKTGSSINIHEQNI